jgi:hypothetical protein
MLTIDKITLNAISEPLTAVDKDFRPLERCALSLSGSRRFEGTCNLYFQSQRVEEELFLDSPSTQHHIPEEWKLLSHSPSF